MAQKENATTLQEQNVTGERATCDVRRATCDVRRAEVMPLTNTGERA
jgi:hypothetical protein